MKINKRPIELEYYGKTFNLDLVLNKYVNGGVAIEVVNEDGDSFAVLTVNVSGLKDNEIAIQHDNLEWARQLYHLLSDEEPTFIQYGMATSEKLILKKEIMEMFDKNFN